jgi:hypothetical protein
MDDAPRGVVDPDARHVEQVGNETERARDPRGEQHRALAQRDDRHGRVLGDRLSEDVDGIRVVEDPGVGTNGVDVLEDVLQDMDRAKRHEEPAGPLRLLTDDPELPGDPLVERPRLESAGRKLVSTASASASPRRRSVVAVIVVFRGPASVSVRHRDRRERAFAVATLRAACLSLPQSQGPPSVASPCADPRR